MSAPNAKRATLTLTLASGAAATRMRAAIGGGAAVPVSRPQRGSSSWLRNRDALATAVAPAQTPRMRASAHFGRRPSAAAQIQQLRAAAVEQQEGVEAVSPRRPRGAKTKQADRKKEGGKVLQEQEEEEAAAAVISEEEEEDPDDLDDDVLESLVATAPSASSPSTTATTISEAERVAWETWHWPDERLALAGLAAAVRAPEVLAAVRTRFIHSPNIMLNSNFDCRFSVDQAAFKLILRAKYGFQATYTPVSYPGLCCPFYLRRGAPLDPQAQSGVPDAHDVVGSAAFGRKYVKATFILFRTGNAFLRGSFSEEVIEFVYTRFQRILVDEYPHIVTRTTRADAKDHRAVVKTRVVYFSRPAAIIKHEAKKEEEETMP